MSEPTISQQPEGWYPDPVTGSGYRLWNGSAWTDFHRENKPPSAKELVGSGTPDGERVVLDLPEGDQYVTFFRAIYLAIRQYATFRGRASRSEYWWWWLAMVLLQLISIPISGGAAPIYDGRPVSTTAIVFAWLYLFASLFVVIPSFAVAARRLHDAGFSAAWLLIVAVGVVPLALFEVIALVGLLVVFVFLLFPSQDYNRFGAPSRKGKPQRIEPKPDLI